jgi:hypothetical protein
MDIEKLYGAIWKFAEDLEKHGGWTWPGGQRWMIFDVSFVVIFARSSCLLYNLTTKTTQKQTRTS